MAKVNYLLDSTTDAQDLLYMTISNNERIYKLFHNFIEKKIKTHGAFLFDAFFSSSTFKAMAREAHKEACKLETPCKRMSVKDRNDICAMWIYLDTIDTLHYIKNYK